MIFYVLIFLVHLSSTFSAVSLTPCCDTNTRLDISNIHQPVCKTSSQNKDQSTFLIHSPSFHQGKDDLEEDSVQIVVDKATNTKMPDCSDGLEVHFLDSVDSWVTKAGDLVTARYEEKFQHGDFCVDTTLGGDLVAVMCNPCTSKAHCIHLCCPHGEAFLENPDYDYNDYNSPSSICTKVDGGVEYNPEVWDEEEDRILEWERNKDYILVAPDKSESNITVGFQCPEEYLGKSWAPEDIGDFAIISDGSLRGENLPDFEASKDGSQRKTVLWSTNSYCMIIGSPPDYSDYSEDNNETAKDTTEDLKLTFMHCIKPEEPSWQETFTKTFHPVALSISIVFLLLSLAVYLLVKGLRETLMGKITIAFILNLSCCFIVITDTYIKDGDKSHDRRETLPCILSGYLILYFFQAFFFWLNAMVIHIWMPFSPHKVAITKFNEKKSFLLCFLYAQGLPILICAITSLIDASGKGLPSSERQLYPEMGVYSCFLGSQKSSTRQSYFTTPVFIYHQSVIILLQVSNLVFLVLTCRHVYTAQNAQNNKNKKLLHQHFSLFVKLFFILGFHWTADLVSTALAQEHGFNETFEVRLFLDLINLFAGVLIFLVLICNRSILSSVQQILCKNIKHVSGGVIKMSSLQEHLTSSDMNTQPDTAA